MCNTSWLELGRIKSKLMWLVSMIVWEREREREWCFKWGRHLSVIKPFNTVWQVSVRCTSGRDYDLINVKSNVFMRQSFKEIF